MEFPIIDETENKAEKHPQSNTEPLSEDFGRNLDTLEKARLWLTNPHNWHESRLHLLKWNGLLCTISREHGERLLLETWDDGLPWAAMVGQRDRRLARTAASGSDGQFKEPEFISNEESI